MSETDQPAPENSTAGPAPKLTRAVGWQKVPCELCGAEGTPARGGVYEGRYLCAGCEAAEDTAAAYDAELVRLHAENAGLREAGRAYVAAVEEKRAAKAALERVPPALRAKCDELLVLELAKTKAQAAFDVLAGLVTP